MPIEVTARHRSATSRIQDYARAMAEELLDEFPRIEHIHVILDVERHLSTAEVVLQGRGHVRIESEAKSGNMMASINVAIDKAEKQMRRIRKKVTHHKGAMKPHEVESAREESD